MYSRVKLFGHPIHPMVVAYPIAFYTATLVAYALYQFGGRSAFWYDVGIAANLAGVVKAVVAALPGFIDWAMGIPGDTEAKTVGLRHMLLNVGALVLFIVDYVLTYANWHAASRPGAGLPLVLALVGVLLTVAAGAHGWTLIQTHHVGVEGAGAEPDSAGSETGRIRTRTV